MFKRRKKKQPTYRRFEQFIVVLTRAGDDVGAARRLRDGRLGGNLDAGKRRGRGEHGCGRGGSSKSDDDDATDGRRPTADGRLRKSGPSFIIIHTSVFYDD